ncbi:MAG: hypothetical protein IH859_03005 [Chloroflexi bacterium]|nr:hypothetical protein [Chloroflexota bacterium]
MTDYIITFIETEEYFNEDDYSYQGSDNRSVFITVIDNKGRIWHHPDRDKAMTFSSKEKADQVVQNWYDFFGHRAELTIRPADAK